LRVRNGEGEVYYTNLLVKLLCLVANRVATLDPSGIGIEMEANKPSWYDSLNGLPGLLGSSICETFELKRFAQFILTSLNSLSVSGSENVLMFEELGSFIAELRQVLGQGADDFEYWKHANAAKERYRESVRQGLTGVAKEMSLQEIRSFLESVTEKVDRAVAAARLPNGLFPTYFYHKVTHYELIDETQAGQEGAHVRPLEFKRHDMPLFFEGFVHALRAETDPVKALALSEAVRKSPLFDKELKMYKLNVDITSETEEVGRTRVFPRGWLENESIWLHMEYKYLLELLRCGLYDQFYRDLSTMCVAFQEPARYGRSILENSSFIVSSAHPDKALHGQGNVARLSGSTAEFVHIWMIMNAGAAPFLLDKNDKLNLVFAPVLKAAFFTQDKTVACYVGRSGKPVDLELPANTYAFNFMGRTLVVYHNPTRRDTFGAKKVVPGKVFLHYAGVKMAREIPGGMIGSPHAEDVRSGKVERIDIHLQ
jgi:hypothetical protein